MWICPKTLKVFNYHYEIRKSFPEVSLPETIGDNMIDFLGLAQLKDTPMPQGKIIEEDTPIQNNGIWYQQWVSREPSTEESDIKSNQMRLQRNGLLTSSDWTQTLDVPVNREAWALYRQQLRDITTQPGFPWDISWPRVP